jgi:hypothetical protein
MDKRAQASLTYRIVTDVLGLSLVLGAFSISTLPDQNVTILLRNLALFAIVFAVLTATWWRLGGMFAIGMLAGRTSAIVGMVVAFNVALAPVFLRLVVSGNAPVREAAANLFTASFFVVILLMAVLVHRSHAYRSKVRWRLIHHSLWLMSGILLLSFFVPLAFMPFAEIPGRFILWALALVIAAVYQRAANRYIANPARPPTQAAGASPVPAGSAASNSGRAFTSDEKTNRHPHGRPQRHGRGGRYRRSSGSRRRM